MIGCVVAAIVALLVVLLIGAIVSMWLRAPGKIPPSDAFLRPDCTAYLIAKLDPTEKGVLSLLQKIEVEIDKKIAESGAQPRFPFGARRAKNPIKSLMGFMPLQLVACETDEDGENVVTIIVSAARGKGWVKWTLWSLRREAGSPKSNIEKEDYRNGEIFLFREQETDSEKEPFPETYVSLIGTTAVLSRRREPVEAVLDAIASPPKSYSGPEQFEELFLFVQNKGQICGVGKGDSEIAKWLLHTNAQDTEEAPLLTGNEIVGWHIKIASADKFEFGGKVVCRDEASAKEVLARIQRRLEKGVRVARVASQHIRTEGKFVSFQFEIVGIESAIEQWFENINHGKNDRSQTDADNRPQGGTPSD